MKADVLNVEAPKSIDLGKVQEQVKEQVLAAQKTGHRAALVYIGLFGCAFDQASGLYQRSAKLVESAVTRGETMERGLNQQLERFGRRTSKQVGELQSEVGEHVEQVTRTVSDKGAGFEEQLEKQVERVLMNLGIPTRDRLERLNQEIDRLNAKLDEELARRDTVHA
jgi:poly(hydroxyalkanoate) granule-associated protein